MKRLLILLLLCTASVSAQTTVVTGTITDPQGNPYQNGTASAQKVVSSGQNPGPPFNTTTNAAGLFSFSGLLALPSPASYIFTICAAPVALGPKANPTPVQQCFANTVPIAISGASQDVSATLNALAPTLGPQVSNITGNALTATSLQNAPVQCGASSLATGITSNGTANCTNSPSIVGLAVSGAQTVGTFDGICLIDGLSTNRTTLAAAFSDVTCSTIDDTGFKSGGTIASTITWPARPVTLKLAAAATYTGPASGPTFIINTFSANGSAILGGSPITSNAQANYGNGTVIKSNAANTSQLIQIASGTGVQVLQGFRLENLVLDGAGSATDLLFLDAVRNSQFNYISYNNCTGLMISMTVTRAAVSQNVYSNSFRGIYGAGCAAGLKLDGNSTATSSTTLNNFYDISFSYTSATLPGIDIRQGDGNKFYGITNIFPTNGAYTGSCVLFEAPVGGSVEGALFNYFHGYHVSCSSPQGGNTAEAQAGSQGNEIFGCDLIENQAFPKIDSGSAATVLKYDCGKLNFSDTRAVGQYSTQCWENANAATLDTCMSRSNAGVISVYNSNASPGTAPATGSVFAGLLKGGQVISDQGTACTNGELALSAGWQSTGSATVTAVAGNGQTCSWTITTGTTTAANPTVTDTLTNAMPAATTVCEMNIHGGTHTATAGEGFQQTALSATAPVFTFNGTPTAGGTTYFVTRRCGP